MKPALAFPYFDPDGTMLPHMRSILPDLKNHFDRAYVCSPPSTLELLKQNAKVGGVYSEQDDGQVEFLPTTSPQAMPRH